MNFLSHYYFERFDTDSEQVVGCLLPDLLRNADKEYTFQFHKIKDQLDFNPKNKLITEGWERHIEVDKIFHNSEFFYTHTHALRKQIEYVVADLPIRASFLAHIALELLLDHLLIEQQLVNVARFYEHLEHIDRQALKNYLLKLEKVDVDHFFNYYDRFVSSRYIFDYAKVDNLPYALYNICKRVWTFTTEQRHIDQLYAELTTYKENHLKNYRSIYTFIQDKIE